jgi:hypothetical protein
MQKLFGYSHLYESKLEETYDVPLASVSKKSLIALSKYLSKAKNVDIQATDFSKFSKINPIKLIRDPRLKDPNYVILYVVKLVAEGKFNDAIKSYESVQLEKPIYKLFFAESGGQALNFSTKYNKSIFDVAFEQIDRDDIVENFAGQEIEIGKEITNREKYTSYYRAERMLRKNINHITYRAYILDLNLVDSNAQIKQSREIAKSGSVERNPDVKYSTEPLPSWSDKAGQPRNEWEGLNGGRRGGASYDKSGYYMSGKSRLYSKLTELRNAAFQSENETTQKAIETYTQKVKEVIEAMKNISDPIVMKSLFEEVSRTMVESYDIDRINSSEKRKELAKPEEKKYYDQEIKDGIQKVRQSFEMMKKWIPFIQSNPTSTRDVEIFRRGA